MLTIFQKLTYPVEAAFNNYKSKLKNIHPSPLSSILLLQRVFFRAVCFMDYSLKMAEILPGLSAFPAWLAVTYGGVLVAMVVDIVTGVRKARRAGIPTRSRGYKKTCDKAVKYLLPMVCLTCIDIISSVFFSAPFLTMAMGAFNIFCEWKSVMETTHEKKQIREAAETIRAIIENREDLARTIIEVIEKELIKPKK